MIVILCNQEITSRLWIEVYNKVQILVTLKNREFKIEKARKPLGEPDQFWGKKRILSFGRWNQDELVLEWWEKEIEKVTAVNADKNSIMNSEVCGYDVFSDSNKYCKIDWIIHLANLVTYSQLDIACFLPLNGKRYCHHPAGQEGRWALKFVNAI